MIHVFSRALQKSKLSALYYILKQSLQGGEADYTRYSIRLSMVFAGHSHGVEMVVESFCPRRLPIFCGAPV